LHLLLFYCRENFQTIICLIFFWKFYNKKTGVLSTVAESKNKQRGTSIWFWRNSRGIFFCEYFSPLATTTLRHQLGANGNPGAVNPQITSLAFFAPRARSLVSTQATYLLPIWPPRAGFDLSLVLLSSILFPGRTPYLFLSRLGYYMNVPSSQIQYHSPTFTPSLIPALLRPFSFCRRRLGWRWKAIAVPRGEQSPFRELGNSLPFNAVSKSSPLDDERGKIFAVRWAGAVIDESTAQ
jgi:hypothetical protein